MFNLYWLPLIGLDLAYTSYLPICKKEMLSLYGKQFAMLCTVPLEQLMLNS